MRKVFDVLKSSFSLTGSQQPDVRFAAIPPPPPERIESLFPPAERVQDRPEEEGRSELMEELGQDEKTFEEERMEVLEAVESTPGVKLEPPIGLAGEPEEQEFRQSVEGTNAAIERRKAETKGQLGTPASRPEASRASSAPLREFADVSDEEISKLVEANIGPAAPQEFLTPAEMAASQAAIEAAEKQRLEGGMPPPPKVTDVKVHKNSEKIRGLNEQDLADQAIRENIDVVEMGGQVYRVTGFDSEGNPRTEPKELFSKEQYEAAKARQQRAPSPEKAGTAEPAVQEQKIGEVMGSTAMPEKEPAPAAAPVAPGGERIEWKPGMPQYEAFMEKLRQVGKLAGERREPVVPEVGVPRPGSPERPTRRAAPTERASAETSELMDASVAKLEKSARKAEKLGVRLAGPVERAYTELKRATLLREHHEGRYETKKGGILGFWANYHKGKMDKWARKERQVEAELRKYAGQVDQHEQRRNMYYRIAEMKLRDQMRPFEKRAEEERGRLKELRDLNGNLRESLQMAQDDFAALEAEASRRGRLYKYGSEFRGAMKQARQTVREIERRYTASEIQIAERNARLVEAEADADVFRTQINDIAARAGEKILEIDIERPGQERVGGPQEPAERMPLPQEPKPELDELDENDEEEEEGKEEKKDEAREGAAQEAGEKKPFAERFVDMWDQLHADRASEVVDEKQFLARLEDQMRRKGADSGNATLDDIVAVMREMMMAKGVIRGASWWERELKQVRQLLRST